MDAKWSKKILAIVSIMAILICAIPMKTDAATVPKALKTSVTKVLNGIKNMDTEAIQKYCKAYEDSDVLEDSENIPELIKYFSKNAKKISYKVGKYSVKGNSATVNVRFKYVDSMEFCQQYFIEFFAYALDNGTTDDETEVYKQMNKIIKNIDFDTKYKEESLSLKFTKYGKTWKLVKFDDKLFNVMLSNYPTSMVDILSNLNE